MRLEIDRTELMAALDAPARVARDGRRTSMPILACVLLEAGPGGEGGLSVRGTCLAHEATSHVSLAVTKERGAVCADAKKLSDVVKRMPAGRLVVSAGNGSLVIKGGRAQCTLATMDAEDYPPPREQVDVAEVTLPSDVLGSLLARVAHAQSDDDTRPHLAGTCLEGGESGLTAIATDGHRLAVATLTREGVPTFRALIPRQAVAVLTAMLAEDDGGAVVSVGASRLRVTLRASSLATQLCDEGFPAWQKVVPKKSSTSVSLDRESLTAALLRCQAVSSDRGAPVRVSVDEGGVTLDSGDVDAAREVLDGVISGPDVTLGINAHYLLDLIGAERADRVSLAFGGELDPVRVTHESTFGVVMPMRV